MKDGVGVSEGGKKLGIVNQNVWNGTESTRGTYDSPSPSCRDSTPSNPNSLALLHSPFMIARLMVETRRACFLWLLLSHKVLFHSFNWILWSPKRSELCICPLKHCKRCIYDSRPCRFHNIFLLLLVFCSALHKWQKKDFLEVFFCSKEGLYLEASS